MLFNKKKDASAGRGISVVELVASHDQLKAIAFGLQWRSVATGGGRDAAIKLVRGVKATHFIYRGQQIGYGAIPGKAASLPPSIYPAALVAAKYHPGDSLYVVQVDQKGDAFWIALIRNGSPTSTDRFIEGIDAAEALALAREIAEPLIEDGVKLSIFTNIERNGIDGARPTSPEDLLDAALIEGDRIQLLPKLKLSIPAPVLAVVGIAVLLLVAQKGYGVLQERERAKIAASNQVFDEDPTVAWTRSIDLWRSSVTGPNSQGLAPVRASMAEVPLEWDGWILSRSSCTKGSPSSLQVDPATGVAISVAAPGISWSCNAIYARTPGGILTRDMVQRVPKKWRASFTPLNQMQMSWSVDSAMEPMVIENLPKVMHHNIETVSRLQTFLPALAQDPSLIFSPVDIKAPVTTAGTPFPEDVRTAGLVQASLVIRAPLRSIDALVAAGIDASWDSLTINYAPQGSQPTINSSVITADITGVLYAKN